MDYHPTGRLVLFGVHFAAIAGPGPLIGPVLAAQWGYLPSFIWIVVGACLAGAVHDFVVLWASVRENGLSLPQIARRTIGLQPVKVAEFEVANERLQAIQRPFELLRRYADGAIDASPGSIRAVKQSAEPAPAVNPPCQSTCRTFSVIGSMWLSAAMFCRTVGVRPLTFS